MHSSKLLTTRYQHKLTQPIIFILRPKRSKFLGAFAKLRKVLIRFVMSLSLSPSVRPSAWNNFLTARIFKKFNIWIFLEKSVEKNRVSLQPDKNKLLLYMRTNIHFSSYLSVLLRMRNVSDKFAEKITTQFYFLTFCWPCISVYLS